jgi:hypothetical protein
MTSWIDLAAVARVLVVGVLVGAGLPALFALGLRALAVAGVGTEDRPDDVGRGLQLATRRPARTGSLVLAGLCFTVVVAAVLYGIVLIVSG